MHLCLVLPQFPRGRCNFLSLVGSFFPESRNFICHIRRLQKLLAQHICQWHAGNDTFLPLTGAGRFACLKRAIGLYGRHCEALCPGRGVLRLRALLGLRR
jgi:hypothetical protein